MIINSYNKCRIIKKKDMIRSLLLDCEEQIREQWEDHIKEKSGVAKGEYTITVEVKLDLKKKEEEEKLEMLYYPRFMGLHPC